MIVLKAETRINRHLAFGADVFAGASRAADLLLVATQGLRVVGATESKIRADSTIQTVLDTLTPKPPVRR